MDNRFVPEAETTAALEAIFETGGRVVFEMSTPHLMILVANVQLALRHRGNTGPSAKIVREICDTLIDGLPEAARKLARLGYDARYDI